MEGAVDGGEGGEGEIGERAEDESINRFLIDVNEILSV